MMCKICCCCCSSSQQRQDHESYVSAECFAMTAAAGRSCCIFNFDCLSVWCPCYDSRLISGEDAIQVSTSLQLLEWPVRSNQL